MDENQNQGTGSAQAPEPASQPVTPPPAPQPVQQAAPQPQPTPQPMQPAAPQPQPAPQPAPQYQREQSVQMPPTGQPNALLKVASVFLIIGAVLCFILGILLFVAGAVAGNGDYSTSGTVVDAFEAAGVSLSYAGSFVLVICVVMGVVFIIAGILDLLMGIFGLKGKYTAGLVMVCIVLAFGVIGLISTISAMAGGNATSSTLGTELAGLVVPVLYLVGIIMSRSR